MVSRRWTLAIVAALSFTAGCQKVPTLTRENARALIESSDAFHEPMDPGVVFIDTNFRPGPNTRREFLRLEGLTVKKDGPFGVAGSTATVAFTWRWTQGPFADRTFRSKARLNSSGGMWKVYDDHLKHELWSAERGELAE